MTKKEEMLGTYFSKPKWTRTWSRIPLKVVFTPPDLNGWEYHKDLGDPGTYPFTRGIHQDMYRGRIWTMRQISGLASARESNLRLKYLIGVGEGGLNVIPDTPSQQAIDSDHPMAVGDVGIQGAPLCTWRDMDALMEGLDLEKVSLTLSAYAPIFVLYVAMAEMRGADLTRMRGTIIGDMVHYLLWEGEASWPLDVAIRLACDGIEFSMEKMPLWNPMNVETYDLRELGITAIQEIAFGFALAFSYIDELLRRGWDIDRVAPRIGFTMAAQIDIFEEAAKFRAARRLWARTMQEKYGAKDPRSLRLRFHTNTAGSMMVRQQIMNNIVRAACGSIAAILGGTQSLDTTPYDEPIMTPTEKSHMVALRTQQILAHEAGLANVADPLAGSYYVEWLTNKIEEEVRQLLTRIDDMGGGLASVASGWMLRECEKAGLEYQTEVESGQRVVVGLNSFTIPEEEDPEPEVQEIAPEHVAEHLAKLEAIKKNRDQIRLRRAIDDLRRKAEDKNQNLMMPMVEAAKADATIGEIMGVIREVHGHHYDPYRKLTNPFN